MPWLDESRGELTDWVTQSWVRATGRRVDLAQTRWLDGPVGSPRGIGQRFFDDLAAREGLAVRREGERGLIADFAALEAADFSPGRVHSSSQPARRTAASSSIGVGFRRMRWSRP